MSEHYRGRYQINSSRLSNWDYRSPGWYFATIRNNIMLDQFIVMPDHVHGIIRIINHRPYLDLHLRRDVACYVSTNKRDTNEFNKKYFQTFLQNHNHYPPLYVHANPQSHAVQKLFTPNSVGNHDITNALFAQSRNYRR